MPRRAWKTKFSLNLQLLENQAVAIILAGRIISVLLQIFKALLCSCKDAMGTFPRGNL